MQKSLFRILLILMWALPFHQTFAQNATQYEYATLMLPATGSGMCLFITSAGMEKIESAEYTEGIAGGWTRGTISRITSLIDITNKKAKDGWEPIIPITEGGFIMLRRLTK